MLGEFVDLQVNGYAGVDFNADSIDPESVSATLKTLREHHVDRILVTLITASVDTLIHRIGEWSDLIEGAVNDSGVIAGLHIEGPFLSPVQGYVGAHPIADVIAADLDVAKRLIDAGRGHVRLLTLAPEQDPGGVVTDSLTRQGVCVAAGHSNASLDQLRESIDHGLQLFTHLGNACPNQLPRHDNIIQRVLSLADRIHISFIADGHHVPAVALKNYLSIVPDDHVIIVTDAIAAAAMGPGRFDFSGQVVEVDQEGAAWSADRTHFAGSAATMPGMATWLSRRLDVDEERLRRWMITNPNRLIGNYIA